MGHILKTLLHILVFCIIYATYADDEANEHVETQYKHPPSGLNSVEFKRDLRPPFGQRLVIDDDRH